MFETLAFEQIAPLASGALGYFAKMQAQKAAWKEKSMMLAIKGLSAGNDSANQASGRDPISGALARRFIVFMLFLVGIGGFLLAMYGDYNISYLYETPVKDRLFGLFEGGGKVKMITGEGFVVTPFMRTMCLNVCMFYFGAGVAKQKI